MSPHWIPPLEPQHEGETDGDYENRIYEIFENDFISSKPCFEGLRVVCRKHPLDNGKWGGFKHITTVDDHKNGGRVRDPYRCERIRFPRKTIEYHADCPSCHYETCCKPVVWVSEKHGKTRIHILIAPEKYLVVLEPHPERGEGYCLLVTAYYVNYEHSFRKLVKEYLECGDADLDRVCRGNGPEEKAGAASAAPGTPSTTW